MGGYFSINLLSKYVRNASHDAWYACAVSVGAVDMRASDSPPRSIQAMTARNSRMSISTLIGRPSSGTFLNNKLFCFFESMTDLSVVSGVCQRFDPRFLFR